ncbi:9747_t:CDS:2, partial [Funneliformis caledonium]
LVIVVSEALWSSHQVKMQDGKNIQVVLRDHFKKTRSKHKVVDFQKRSEDSDFAIWRAVMSAVKRAADLGIDDDGKLEAKTVLKEAIGEFW